VFPNCLPGFKEHVAQQRYVKGVLVLPFFPQLSSAAVSKGSFNCFPAFSMARSVAKLVAVVLILK